MKTNVMLGVLMVACYAPLANATAINDGAAYAIADNFLDHDETAGTPGEGSHFHASNVLPVDPDNSTVIAANVAEVGGLGNEAIRGLVEFNLAGQAWKHGGVGRGLNLDWLIQHLEDTLYPSLGFPCQIDLHSKLLRGGCQDQDIPDKRHQASRALPTLIIAKATPVPASPQTTVAMRKTRIDCR